MTRTKISPEILAPCGSYDILVAAVAAGCDACYIGGNKYSARAYADNPDMDSLIKAIDYAHLHDTKLYLTVNTLFKQDEITDLTDYLRPYYEAGLDAVIVQDLGAFRLIRREFPDMSIHCSTQMNITSLHAARFMYEQGASRIVTAREMPLDEISIIKDRIPELEIETFVHGAMCYSYSGQCLMSSLAGGRSGNRGRCAQPCRKCYDGDYILSMKDMCALELLPDIIDAGIDSLKIEGRMKNAYYVASAVDAYREMRDACMEGSFDIDRAKQLKFRLASIFNRGGFTDGYFFIHNSSDMISKDRPNNQGVKIGKLTGINNGTVTIRLFADLYKGDVLELKSSKGSIVEITSGVNGKIGEAVTLKAPGTKYLLKKQDIYRTRCNYLLESIDRQDKIKIPLEFHLSAKVGEPLKAQVICNTDLGSFLAEKSLGLVEATQNKKPDLGLISSKICQTGDTDYHIQNVKLEVEENAFVPMGLVKQLRRDTISELEQQILQAYRRKLPDAEKNCSTENDNANGQAADVYDKKISGSDRMGINIRTANQNQLKAVLEYAEKLTIHGIYMPLSLYRKADELGLLGEITGRRIKLYLELPYIIDNSFDMETYLPKYKINGIYIRNIDGFCALKKYMEKNHTDLEIVCGSSLYAYNTESLRFMAECNMGNIITELPRELNLKELATVAGGSCEYFAYGYQQVMLSNQCLVKSSGGCNHGSETVKITDDKGNSFYGVCCCDSCFNVIYNGRATCMLHKLEEISGMVNPDFIRLEFTIENENETRQVMDMLVDAVIHHDTSMIKSHINMYTMGHNNRGVE